VLLSEPGAVARLGRAGRVFARVGVGICRLLVTYSLKFGKRNEQQRRTIISVVNL
jgi:hypothetical protein